MANSIANGNSIAEGLVLKAKVEQFLELWP